MPTPFAQPRPDDREINRRAALQGISSVSRAQQGPQPAQPGMEGQEPTMPVPQAVAEAVRATVRQVGEQGITDEVIAAWQQAFEFLKQLVSQATGQGQAVPGAAVPPGQAPVPQGPPGQVPVA
jgi:hypothetical protein